MIHFSVWSEHKFSLSFEGLLWFYFLDWVVLPFSVPSPSSLQTGGLQTQRTSKWTEAQMGKGLSQGPSVSAFNSFTLALDVGQEGNIWIAWLEWIDSMDGEAALLLAHGCSHTSFSPSWSKLQKSRPVHGDNLPLPLPLSLLSTTSLPEAGCQGPKIPKPGCTALPLSLPPMMNEGMAPAVCSSLRPVGDRKGQTWGKWGIFWKGLYAIHLL